MFDGNFILASDKIVDEDKSPNPFFTELINALVDRVFIDVHLGSGAPSASLGGVNDLYIDLNALTFYTRGATVWSSSTALDNNTDTVLLISAKQ